MQTRKQPKQRLPPIPFRVTAEERKQIEDASTRVGLTMSAYIRTQVLEKSSVMRATRKPSVEKELLAKLLGQTGQINYNLQQIIKKLGTGKNLKELDKAIDDLRQTAIAIMETLGRKPRDH